MPGRFSRCTTVNCSPTRSDSFAGPPQHFVRGEEIVYVSHHLHTTVGEHDQVVGEPLELRDDVDEKITEKPLRRPRHDNAMKSVAGERVEPCKRSSNTRRSDRARAPRSTRAGPAGRRDSLPTLRSGGSPVRAPLFCLSLVKA